MEVVLRGGLAEDPTARDNRKAASVGDAGVDGEVEAAVKVATAVKEEHQPLAPPTSLRMNPRMSMAVAKS